jgi:hypothetical protein
MIRPIDLQTTILSAQTASAPQRAEDAARTTAQATQAAFAAEITRRDESVAPAAEVAGNRIGAKPEEHDKHGRDAHKRKPASPFEEVVNEAGGNSEEPAHIVDFTA